MWESPIQISTISEEIGRKIVDDQNNYIVETCVKMGVNVDKDELLKALAYDRGQYEKGYADGRRARDSEIVRCKDCIHRPTGTGANHDLEFPDYVCPCQCEDFWYSWMPKDDWFCASGERGEDAEVHK